jgi:hypothetical protein
MSPPGLAPGLFQIKSLVCKYLNMPSIAQIVNYLRLHNIYYTMPTCRKCGVSFPNYLKIDGIVRNISNRKFCINCSPFGFHNTRSLSPRFDPPNAKRCAKCNLEKPVSDFFISKSKISYYCRECHQIVVLERIRNNKLYAVKYLGGKCIRCGYNSCVDALDFHHREPSKKEGKMTRVLRRSFKNIKKELDKCDLVCCRCHREIHSEWDRRVLPPRK